MTKELGTLRFIANEMTLRSLRINIFADRYNLPTVAGGTLDTLWQYLSPSVPNISYLDMNVPWYDSYNDLDQHDDSQEPGRHIVSDAGASLLAIALKRIEGIGIRRNIGNSTQNSIWCDFESGEFVSFNSISAMRGPDFVKSQLVHIRRDGLSAEQQEILNREASATAGLGSRRDVWVTEKIMEKLTAATPS